MSEQKYKLTLDEMLELSRRIPSENWGEAPVIIPKSLLEINESSVTPEKSMYKGSHSEGIEVSILTIPSMIRGIELGYIYAYFGDVEIGAEKDSNCDEGDSLRFEKIKQRYQEIADLIIRKPIEKQKVGYGLALRLLRDKNRDRRGVEEK